MDHTGRIERTHTGTCAACNKQKTVFVDTKREAESTLRAHGWRSSNRGWVCPTCKTHGKQRPAPEAQPTAMVLEGVQ